MTETLKIPTKVIDSAWEDDIPFELYKREPQYVYPENVENVTAKNAKSRIVKMNIGQVALFGKNDKLAA